MQPGFALSPLSGLSHVGIGSTELPKLKQESSKNNKKGLLFYQRFVTNLKKRCYISCAMFRATSL